jgi:hypothetical protein
MPRLDFLVTLGVAERTGIGAWELSRYLERTVHPAQLRETSSRTGPGTRPTSRTRASRSVVTRIEAGTRLAGRVVGTGLADELLGAICCSREVTAGSITSCNPLRRTPAAATRRSIPATLNGG